MDADILPFRRRKVAAALEEAGYLQPTGTDGAIAEEDAPAYGGKPAGGYWFKFPDNLVKPFCRLSSREKSVLLAVLWQTSEPHKTTDKLTSTVLADLTGLHSTHARSTVRELIGRSVLTALPGKSGPLLSVNLDAAQWMWTKPRTSGGPKQSAQEDQNSPDQNSPANGPKQSAQEDQNSPDTVKRNKEDKDLDLDFGKIEEAKPAKPELKKPAYKSKKGRGLSGECLTAFLQFWNAFDYKQDKANAADAWLTLWTELEPFPLPEILAAAKRTARDRPRLRLASKTPQMAQGWLSGRRWEDEAGPSGGDRVKWISARG